MSYIKREFYGVSRSDVFTILPLFDLHIGARACAEDKLRKEISHIAKTKNTYWIFGGDGCDFVRHSDPRFSARGLASWVETHMLDDLSRHQADRFLDIVEPAASKCLVMVEGNHETAINRHDGFDIYRYMVDGVKDKGGLGQHKLGIGYEGTLDLVFYGSKEGEKKEGKTTISIALHHGFTGGRLKGAKGLNMQKYLWYTRCDIALHGHSHNTDVFTEGIKIVTPSGKTIIKTVYGAFCGSFLSSVVDGATLYNQIKGYPPLPLARIVVKLQPRAEDPNKRVEIAVSSR